MDGILYWYTHKVGHQRHAQEESYNLHIYVRDTPSSIPLTKSFFQHSSWHNLVMRNKPSPSTRLPADSIWNSLNCFIFSQWTNKCPSNFKGSKYQWHHRTMDSDWNLKDPLHHFLWLESNLLISYHPISVSLTRPIRHWNWHSITGNIWRCLLLLVTGRDSRCNWDPPLSAEHLSWVWPALIRSDWPGSAHSVRTFIMLQGRLLQMLSKALKWHKNVCFWIFFPAYLRLLMLHHPTIELSHSMDQKCLSIVDYCFVLRMHA